MKTCDFDRVVNAYKCRHCGLTVDIQGGEGTPKAICGQPGSLRVIHGSEEQAGVGTWVKRLLAFFGIKAGPNCRCGERAKLLDERGPDWAELHVDEIVGWLQEEATERNLPFSKFAATLLVRKAIRLARTG